MLQKILFVILTLGIITTITIISGGILVGVANAAAPGDALYRLDRGMEIARLQLTRNSESKALLLETYAEERLQEIRQLVERGDQASLDETMQSYTKPLAEISAPPAVPGDDLEGEDETGAYCDGKKDKNHPSGGELAERYQTSYEEIMAWFCAGYGFGEIDLAYEIAQFADVPLTEIFAQRAAGAGWGEIMLAYDFKDASLDDDEPEDEDDEDGDGENGAYCGDKKEKNHPSGDKLAERYGVSYTEIMDWFCQGNGFGEIDLAYAISQAAEVSVESLFAQRAGGAGWGEIKQAYGLIGKDKAPKDKAPKDKAPKDKEPKDKDKDKTK